MQINMVGKDKKRDGRAVGWIDGLCHDRPGYERRRHCPADHRTGPPRVVCLTSRDFVHQPCSRPLGRFISQWQPTAVRGLGQSPRQSMTLIYAAKFRRILAATNSYSPLDDGPGASPAILLQQAADPLQGAA